MCCHFAITFVLLSVTHVIVVASFQAFIGTGFKTFQVNVQSTNIKDHAKMGLIKCIMTARNIPFGFRPIQGSNLVDCYHVTSVSNATTGEGNAEETELTKVEQIAWHPTTFKYAVLQLLSQGKPSTQSSTWTDGIKYPWAVSETAFDGVFNQNFIKGGCTHTKIQSSPAWIQVDLLFLRLVINVKIYNRLDCCSDRLVNATIFVSRQDNVFQMGDVCRKFNDIKEKDQVARFWCYKPIQGRFVRLLTEAYEFSICEFQVFGI